MQCHFCGMSDDASAMCVRSLGPVQNYARTNVLSIGLGRDTRRSGPHGPREGGMHGEAGGKYYPTGWCPTTPREQHTPAPGVVAARMSTATTQRLPTRSCISHMHPGDRRQRPSARRTLTSDAGKIPGLPHESAGTDGQMGFSHVDLAEELCRTKRHLANILGETDTRPALRAVR